MINKRPGELLDKCLEGTATPTEENELLELASASPDVRDYIIEMAELDASLHTLTYDKDAFVDRVMGRIMRTDARQSFTNRMLDRLQQKPEQFSGCVLPFDEELDDENKQPSTGWMKAVFYSSAAAIVILLSLLVLQPMLNREEPILQIASMTGKVTYHTGSTTIELPEKFIFEQPGSIRTGAGASLILSYADGSTVEVGQFTDVSIYPHQEQKRIDVSRGLVRASVKPQPSDSPMILRADDTDAVVLGTELIFARGPSAVFLQVEEGRVRLRRFTETREESLIVESGQVSIAERGSPLLRAVTHNNFATRALTNVLQGLPTTDLLRVNPDGNPTSTAFFAGQTLFGFDPNGQLDAPLLTGNPIVDFNLDQLPSFRREMKHTFILSEEGDLPDPWTVEIPDPETIGVVALEKDNRSERKAFSLRNIAGRASVQLTTWRPYELPTYTSSQFTFSYRTSGNAALRFRYQVNGVEQNPVILPPTDNKWRTYAVYLETEANAKGFRPIFQNVGIGRENVLYIRDLNLIAIPDTMMDSPVDDLEYRYMDYYAPPANP